MLVASLALLSALAGSPPDSVPLYDNLGDFHRKVTARPLAQRYFDQGLRLHYAFNHAEAIRAFEEGARRDSRCAMCWWGGARRSREARTSMRRWTPRPSLRRGRRSGRRSRWLATAPGSSGR